MRREVGRLRVRHHDGGDALVGVRVLLLELRGDGLGLRLGLRDPVTGLQPAHDEIARTLAALRGERVGGERQPGLLSERKREPLGHHTNDGAHDAVRADRPAHDARRPSKPLAPELRIDEQDRLGPRAIVPGAKAAPEDRLNTERFECGDAELPGGESLGPPFLVGEIHGHLPICADGL